jgi:perosamine synthetase
MFRAVSRGRISHPLSLEIMDFLQLMISPINRPKTIQKYEQKIGQTLNDSQILFYPLARTAFYAILKSIDLPLKSKVLLPTITIKPMLDIVENLGLEPLFVDVNRDTGCWDADALSDALKHKPKVALLTYLFGVVPNLDEIMHSLRSEAIVVIEDFSQAFGAKFKDKNLGTFGDFGICSTSITKTFDTYGGALLVVNNKKYLNTLKAFRSQMKPPSRRNLARKILRNIFFNLLTNRICFNFLTFPLIRIINAKQNHLVGKYTGERSLTPIKNLPQNWFEYPSSFQAKIGLRELKKQYNKDKKRIAIANRYTNELNLPGPRGIRTSHSVYWQYIVIDPNPIDFRKHLNKNFIDCATTSLVNLADLPKYGIQLNLPNSSTLYSKGVYLPCYHQLTNREQTKVIAVVKKYLEKQ